MFVPQLLRRLGTKRAVAGGLSLALATAALVVAPLGISTATATAAPTPTDLALGILDQARAAHAAPLGAFERNRYVDDWAQAYAVNLAACGGCTLPIPATLAIPFDSGSPNMMIASGGTAADRVTRIANDFIAIDPTYVYSASRGWASIGFVVKGSTTYATLVTVLFSDAPNDEIRPGTVTLPSVITVGVPIVPTITGFDPGSSADYTLQWFDGDTGIGSGSGFPAPAGVVGHKLTLKLTDSVPGYDDVTVTSAPSKAVLAGTIVADATWGVTGSRNVGSTLTVNVGTWSIGSPGVQWYRNGVAISDATANTYVQTTADYGKRIDVKLKDVQPGYTTLTKSTSDKVLTGHPLLTTMPKPTIAGTTTFGQALTVTPGSWGPGTVALKYQWLLNGAAIKGATGTSLTLGAAEMFGSISVTVTGSESGYAATTETSDPTLDVQGLVYTSVFEPVITGTPVIGQTLGVTIPAWSPVPTSFTYQWSYVNYTRIPGATKSTYKPTAADAGKQIVVFVYGSRTGYHVGTSVSEPVTVTASP